MPASAATTRISSCAFRPAGPISAKPNTNRIAARAPAAAASTNEIEGPIGPGEQQGQIDGLGELIEGAIAPQSIDLLGFAMHQQERPGERRSGRAPALLGG